MNPTQKADALSFCEEGNVERLREWVASPEAELDQTGAGGETALHVACRRGFIKCVRVLVAAGAAMDVQDAYGRTPMQAALIEGYVNVAVLLMHSGADVDIKNSVSHFSNH